MQLEQIWIKSARMGPMNPTERATLVVDAGLEGDANKGGERQVTILSKERWAEACTSLGADIDPTSRRANLFVSGLDLVDSGDKILQVGACRIHVLGETRPCGLMDKMHDGLKEELRSGWGGGVYGNVIEGGEIAAGDAVAWLDS